MKPDTYTKIVLTVIALALVLVACKPMIQPESVAAEGPFAGVVFTQNGNMITLFDTKTGKVYTYNEVTGKAYTSFQIPTPLGQDLVGRANF